MHLYQDQGDVLDIIVRQQSYPVQVSGQGLPVLTLGPGSAMHRTLSAAFRQHFKLYALDLYWIESYSREDNENLSLKQIFEDFLEAIHALNLQKPIIWGHSAFGILALEFAKAYPQYCGGVIMIGTPLNSNMNVAKINQAEFDKLAEPERKALYASRQAEIAELDLADKSVAERFVVEYIYGDSAKYWHQADFNCHDLWQGLLPPPEFMPLFETVLPAIDVKQALDKIQVPVYLTAGMSDYDCCPWHWESLVDDCPLITVERYQHSGHYPHYEEQALFDDRIISFKSQFKC